VLLLFLFFPTMFSVLFPASDEVSYAAGITSSTCGGFFGNDDSDGTLCTTRYAVVIDNTGTNPQEIVTVELRPLPAGQLIGWNVLDIVASSVRSPPPNIIDVALNDGRRLVIEGLAPNRQVEFTLSGRSLESVASMENIAVTVAANGRAIASNPTLTVLSRFFKNVFGVFAF